MLIQTILLNAVVAADSTTVAQALPVSTQSAFQIIVDIAYKLSMVAIALFNVFYVWRLNRSQNKEKDEQRKTERRMDLLKTIALAPNLSKMYKFLDDLWDTLKELKLENVETQCTEAEKVVKERVEPKLQDLFKTFRSDFIIILNATVPKLGKNIESICDTMRDTLIDNMADEGINLWVTKYFNDKIKAVYEQGKMDMVNELFNYDGKE